MCPVIASLHGTARKLLENPRQCRSQTKIHRHVTKVTFSWLWMFPGVLYMKLQRKSGCRENLDSFANKTQADYAGIQITCFLLLWANWHQQWSSKNGKHLSCLLGHVSVYMVCLKTVIPVVANNCRDRVIIYIFLLAVIAKYR